LDRRPHSRPGAARRTNTKSLLLIVLPLIVSVSFFLIADIDSPRGGVVRVTPQNLVDLVDSLRTKFSAH